MSRELIAPGGKVKRGCNPGAAILAAVTEPGLRRRRPLSCGTTNRPATGTTEETGVAQMITELYRALKLANVPDEAAEAAAEAVADRDEGVVSKEFLRAELRELEDRLDRRLSNKLYAPFGTLAVLVTVYEFVG